MCIRSFCVSSRLSSIQQVKNRWQITVTGAIFRYVIDLSVPREHTYVKKADVNLSSVNRVANNPYIQFIR